MAAEHDKRAPKLVQAEAGEAFRKRGSPHPIWAVLRERPYRHEHSADARRPLDGYVATPLGCQVEVEGEFGGASVRPGAAGARPDEHREGG